MVKGKTLNPADAYRKAQRKKELKKNKAGRVKSRDVAMVKKDTTEIEEEIEKLTGISEPTSAEKARLKELKSELEKINKKKEEYVKEHPEHRKLVYRPKKGQNERDTVGPVGPQERNLFKKNGLPRRPERSIYYDPVMNPYGVAPPGMPYMERPLRPDEIESDEQDKDSDDSVAMPEGPPPDEDDQEEDSDEDIPMPEGPPPLREPPSSSLPYPAIPMHIPHPPFPLQTTPLPPNFPFLPSNLPPGVPPPPLGMPPPPLGFPIAVGPTLPPPPGFPPFLPNFGAYQMPLPPPGFFPRRQQSASATQDPLSNTPHQTYQAHRESRLGSHPSLPQKLAPASAAPLPPPSAVTSAATISAAPELRDLKKEATAFIPSALTRKKASSSKPPPPKHNSAPEMVGSESMEPVIEPARPDIVSVLKEQFGPATAQSTKSSGRGMTGGSKGKDEYEKFLKEMGDILGPAP